ncbi:3'-5' exonuclease [Recurvomyces mirabilis]|uniref:RNA exonuclease 4 n=1 Tax=Recurvomyces mirabilis TaxID=574656 RepID=A0AAE0WUJ9_9PEZI|nr:3'-5' exonuclease [Recurvomyces mirabilis]KAK5160612.1 3'-5' exonuclease [Recurvomyces mirabilis]
MPGLELSGVSSNWKKLQSQLQAEKKTAPPPPPTPPPSNGVKRKRQETRPGSAFKRAKFSDANGTQVVNRRKMGYSTSKPVTDPPKSNSNLTRDHDHDITSSIITTSSISTTRPTDTPNTGHHPTHKLGKYIALDCEMVGTGPPPHTDHLLARVSLVNYHGDQLYDSYVLPPPGSKVHDYRTHVSGIQPPHLHPDVARSYNQVRADVAELLRGRILVGHALKNDLQVLDMVASHPKCDLRDTSRYPPFRAMSGGRPPALRKLAERVLGLKIQEGEHSSVEDARASMLLFRTEKEGFEAEVRRRFGRGGVEGRGGGRRGVVGGGGKGGGKGWEGGNSEEEDSILDEEDDEDEEEGFGSEGDGVGDGDGRTKISATTGAATTKKKRKKKKRTKRK